MPRPPPPAAALIITGKPVASTTARAASKSSIRPLLPGMVGTPAFDRGGAAGDLVAHQADGLAARADEGQARLLDRVGEGRVLGEEAVAGMDRVDAGRPCRGDDRADVEIGLGRLRRADLDRLVGEADGERIGVGGAVGLDRVDAELARGADDP